MNFLLISILFRYLDQNFNRFSFCFVNLGLGWCRAYFDIHLINSGYKNLLIEISEKIRLQIYLRFMINLSLIFKVADVGE